MDDKDKKKRAGGAKKTTVRATKQLKNTRFIALPPELSLTIEDYKSLCSGSTLELSGKVDKRFFEEV